MNSSELLTTNRKALTVNLDEAKYGTFAEIVRLQKAGRSSGSPLMTGCYKVGGKLWQKDKATLEIYKGAGGSCSFHGIRTCEDSESGFRLSSVLSRNRAYE